MMFASLEGRTPCWLCGHRLRVIRTGALTVNKRSLRFRGDLICAPRECGECGEHQPDGALPVTGWALHPDDMLKVGEIRARRWSEQGVTGG